MFFLGANFLISLVIGIGLQVLGYLLMGQPKTSKPEAAQDMDAPTAEAGRPLPVPFGEVEIMGLNIIHYTEKETVSYEVKA